MERSFCFKGQGHWGSPALFWEFDLKRRPAGKPVRKRGCLGQAVMGYMCKRAGSFGLGLDIYELMEFSERSQNNPVELCGSCLKVMGQRCKSLEKTGHLSSNYLMRILSTIGIGPSNCPKELCPRGSWGKEMVAHSWGGWEIIEKEGLKAVQHQVRLFLAWNALTREDFLLTQIDGQIQTQNWGDLWLAIRCAGGSLLRAKTGYSLLLMLTITSTSFDQRKYFQINKQLCLPSFC